MRAKKPSGLISVAGAIKLLSHAMMGTALGLAFALTLVLTNPAVAALLADGGNTAGVVFIAALVASFSIGATLTGAVFILAENKEV
ncbi:hypothetical protein [Bradyrhizobium sp.]|uniref:hypothetical protein n=1 Tax=Bradyrhizobium sp. TaxID=376 RepID=UPI0023A3B888|nr:hypothetical protein [Bradyrhizobium sp.]MDE2377434.1 hypothetical protein [Bradyrhizobium sp.]